MPDRPASALTKTPNARADDGLWAGKVRLVSLRANRKFW